MKLDFLPRLQMDYLDYYGNCVQTGLDPHVCETCENLSPEHANISGGAWIHKDAIAAILVDPTDATIWQAQIDLGLVIILPDLRGSFDGGTPKIGPGFGRSKGKYQGSDFKVSISDKVYQENWAHYRSLVGKTSYYLCYVTETQGHITGVPVDTVPKAPITENVDDLIIWVADCTWFEYFSPMPFDAPLDIFTCVPS